MKWKNIHHIPARDSREKTIFGILNPIHWDRHGNISQYSIYSNGEDIIIKGGYHGTKRLHRLLNKKVMARGHVGIDENDERYVILKSIKECKSSKISVSNISEFGTDEYTLSIPKEYALAQYGFSEHSFRDAC